MSEQDVKSQFVARLVEHQPRIYAYIRGLIPERAAADDVYQNVCVVLWKKIDTFDHTTNFLAWALETARYEVLAHHRDHGRDRLRFGREELELLAAEAQAEIDELSELRAALESCLQKLPERQRQLLVERYQPDQTVGEIARRWNRPVQTIYTMLKRSRMRLLECVQLALRQQEAGHE